MENPDSSANSVHLDVTALNAELMDRGTTTERVEEILAEVSGHSDLGEPGIATDATSWEKYSATLNSLTYSPTLMRQGQ